MARPLWWLGVAVAVATVSGCSGVGPDAAGAANAAQAFHAETSDGEGDAACARLDARAVDELEQSGQPCRQAVLAADVPDAAQVRDVQVWGGRGIVVLDHDVVFVARFDSGWRVTAAGCSPREDRPYECIVKGG